MKLDIPKFRYLAQDYDGQVWCYIGTPYIPENENNVWFGSQPFLFYRLRKKINPNWKDTLIDLETDDYEFEDGILRRIEK